jgi:hypothetical protein
MSGPMVFAPGTEAAAAPRSEHVRLTVRPRRLEPAFQQHADPRVVADIRVQCEQTESDVPEPPQRDPPTARPRRGCRPPARRRWRLTAWNRGVG